MKKGAKLELLIKESCELQNILYQRLKDGASRTGPGGEIIRLKSSNISDMIIFNGETFLYLEAKSYTSSIPFADLRQLKLMLNVCESYSYIKAGFLIEFKNLNEYYYVSAQHVYHLMLTLNKKSFSKRDLIENSSKCFAAKTWLPLRKRVARIDIKNLLETI